jgi:hypothetical protein
MTRYRIENRSPGKKLGLPPGTAKIFTHEELAPIAAAVLAHLVGPMQQHMVPSKNAEGEPITKFEMRPGKSMVHIFVVEDDGDEVELSAKAFRAAFADVMAAKVEAKAAKGRMIVAAARQAAALKNEQR